MALCCRPRRRCRRVFNLHDTNPSPPITEFSNTIPNHEDVGDNDDVLRFLDFSPVAPAAGNELLEAEVSAQDLSYWGLADKLSVEMTPAKGGWVPPTMLLDCRECVGLREMIHSNGVKNMRLSTWDSWEVLSSDC